MSFHQNGNRRYGAVPPAQYGATQDQGHLRRQSSFDDGDDAPFFDNNINLRRTDSSNRTAGITQGEAWMDPSQNSYQSPTRATYASTSPSALSGYQHQFQPSSASPQPAHAQPSPPTYNPQQFARTLSQSQQHSTPYPGNAQVYPSSSGAAAIAPYNPALYQGQASLQRQPTQSSQPSYTYNQSYTSPTVPQSLNYWPSQTSLDHTYNQSQPGHNTLPIPLPPKPSAYLPQPQAAPYSPNGSNYAADRPSSQHGRSSQTIRTSASTELPYPLDPPYRIMPTPPISQREAPFQSSGIQRHPTLRPLPSAPVEEDVADEWDDANTYTAEELQQERLFQDINSNLHQYSSRLSDSHQTHGDLLDGELEERRRYDSEATTLFPASEVQASIFDDDSDPEAAAGLQAMRLADEQDALRESGSLFESQNGTLQPTTRSGYQDASSDSDYAHAPMDIGLYSGGYAGHISYGASNFDLNHDSRDEMNDQSRPLPTPHEIRRPEEYNPPLGLGGIVPSSIYGPDLQHPGGRARSYSYNEDDERSSIPSREADSRLSGRSGSSSPNKHDYGEYFYGPGPTDNGERHERPLPALPSEIEPVPKSASVPRPTGTYGTPHDGQYPWALQQNFAPNGYEQTLSPTSQVPPIPRSASHTSRSNHPKAVPPIRAKSDAEERQAAKHRISKGPGPRAAGSLDGYDSGLVSSDLPNIPAGGRRKKFKPDKLSSKDFEKCEEAWSLSSVASWLKEMCGSETDDVDSDLREYMLSEGLVNLFTHKVPTMNTTDAEALSEYVIKSMFAAGLLIREEEWVKLGTGGISGVLWQMTGSGCYSPKLHNTDLPGRCYSHHCSRTLKKITLQPSGASHERADWETFYKVTDEQKKGKSKKEIERQHVIHEVVTSEHLYMDHLYVLGMVYREGLLRAEPPVITPTRLNRVVDDVYGRVDAIKKVNENYLLPQLIYKQQIEGPWIAGCGNIFREWIRKARQPYLSYAAALPNAIYQVRKEMERNILFVQFLNVAREHELSGRLSWDSFLKAPTTRLQRYPLLLTTVLKTMQEDNEEKATLEKAIEEIKLLCLECNNKLAEAEKDVELRELSSKLVLRPGMGPQDLCLRDPQRELLFRGDLVRAGNNRFTWLDTRAILYDHYFILAKVVPSKDSTSGKRGERYDVSKPPIPMQLLVLEGANDDPVVKRDVKGIGAVTTTARSSTPTAADVKSRNAYGDRPHALNHTNTNSSLDNLPKANLITNLETDEKRMYPFRIKHLGRADVYTLFASSAKIRDEWCEHIVAAKTRHAASLYEQNAEPFSLKVIADSAFAYDDATAASMKDPGVPVRETPLYRAVREINDTLGPMRPGPVCRAQVNCGTGFTAYGKAMLAIGTDYGVYISEVSNPRGWTRAIQTSNVAQIAVLEEFSIFLVIASKSLIAYHLDVVVPVSDFPPPHQDSSRRAPQRLSSSNVAFFATCRMKDRTLVIYKKREGTNSVFKILEPILQKSTEKKAKMFGRKMLGGGVTEFFREFDEFYIPVESYGLNAFSKTLAVPTTRGFELLTLDNKDTTTVPNPTQSFESIAPRLKGQKPLGMFRLDENDFMLVYEDCGVYIDKHGDISRSVILELIGKAKSATMYEGYLLLFNDDFVEVRDSKSGRLRQIVAGRDIRCLDAGVEGRGEGGHRSVKIAMSHPEHATIQLVLELVLNDDSREWKG